ncbi:MAG: molecular chaperone TorD family protein [Coriobacteriia bacterium]|nr:molecular chaperone TorD family protein [Coriobacteriia bacterium]
MEKQGEMLVALENRAYNYLLFKSVFGTEPNRELLEAVCSDASRQALAVFALEDDASFSEAFIRAQTVMDAIIANLDETLEALKSEYTRFFIGPSNPKASPWESTYTSYQRSLFQESTLEVRNAYRAQGFLPADYPRVADDHIALECAFMAQLGDRARAAYEAGDAELLKTALEASLRFLEDHLLVWVPAFTEKLAGDVDALLYPGMALLLSEYLKVDQALLGELLAEV